MGTGYLEVVTTTAYGAMPIVGAKVTIYSGDTVLYELTTDKSGLAKTVALEAPPEALTTDKNFDGIPYSVYDVRVEAEHFITVLIHDVEILATETSILPVSMFPAEHSGDSLEFFTPPHNLVTKEPRTMEIVTEAAVSTHAMREVVIPEFITVHLGRPGSTARNVRVPFIYYIKNCASHEIYSTWPPASLEANIYCIISLTLNRIFTKTHRKGRQNKFKKIKGCELPFFIIKYGYYNDGRSKAYATHY